MLARISLFVLVTATGSLAQVAMSQEIAPPGQESRKDGVVAGIDDAVMVATRMVAQMKEMSRHYFERFEAEWAAADELREAEREKSQLMRELRKQHAKAAEKLEMEFGAHEFKCHQLRNDRANAKLMLNAESATARTTAADVTKADTKLQAALKDLPSGEGPAYQAMKAYHAKLTACEELRDQFNDQHVVLTHKLLEARREWFALDKHVRARLELVTDSWEEKLNRLLDEAEEAKRAKANNSDADWPQEKRWPAARRRYEEFLAREPDFGAALKP